MYIDIVITVILLLLSILRVIYTYIPLPCEEDLKRSQQSTEHFFIPEIKTDFSYVRDPLLHPVWGRHTDLK